MSRFLLAILILGGLCFADTITLKDGRVVQGTYLGGDARTVKVAIGDRVDTYSVDELASIRFGGADAPTAQRSYDTPRDDPSASRRSDDRRSDDRRPENPTSIPQPSSQRPPQSYDRPAEYRRDDRSTPPPGNVLVSAGTSLIVRMIDSADSERDTVGQTYRASIDEPVVVDGQTVIPRGADVVVKLVDDKQSGKLEGRTVLTLDLMQVQVNGRMVDVNTTDVSEQSSSRGARTGKVVGGATVLGTIIGAVAGGGKGAAIGAVSGAAAGTGAQIMTKGQRVRIPSETRLTFVLQQPLLP
jgi:hypothetical protein